MSAQRNDLGEARLGLVVPKRLAREMFWYGEARLTIGAPAWRAQSAWIDTLFADLKARPGFHLVSLRDRLCNNVACRVYDSTLQRPIYVDQSHFDPLWIIENGHIFAPFVRG